MSVKRVIVIYKRSALEELKKKPDSAAFNNLLKEKHPSVKRMAHVDSLHSGTMDSVKTTLDRLGLESEFVRRSDLEKSRKALRKADLVITVGGDGTVLEAGHNLIETPVLGVNSSPGVSVGSLCGTNKTSFAKILKLVLEGKIHPVKLTRIEARVNGKPMNALALNEVLLAHENPAGTSRYIISIGHKSEEHKSSGIYVATATGSTAAIWTAGGKIMPIRSQRLQYLTREIYREKKSYNFKHGFISQQESIIILPKMSRASLFIDGPGIQKRVGFGDEISLQKSDKPLKVLAYDEKRREKLFGRNKE